MQTIEVGRTEKYQTLQLFRMEDITMSLEDQVASATEVIMDLFAAGHPIVVATSFGKDSSVVTSIVMNAAKTFASQGGRPLVVATSSDTLVENPEVHAMAKEEMGKLHAFAEQHGIRFFGKFVTPPLLSTFQVKVLSGRGIPSWASGGNDCAVDLKLQAQKSYRKKLFRVLAEKGMREPVTCLGMRIQESEVRAARMRQSGARAETPVRNKDGELVLCPVQYWSEDDIFEYLGECSSGLREAYSDFKETLRIYAHSAGTSCAVVAQSIYEGRQKKGGCGARHGCFTCLKAEDKSLAAMIELDPRYVYMRGLNRLNKYLRAIEKDWSRRHWVGRTIQEGYILIQPDTLHPTELRNLTRYMMQLDHDEWVRSRRAGEQRKFTLLPLEMMIAVDALQSLNGIARPFAIWDDYRSIYEKGIRFDIPDVAPFKETPLPDAKFLYVGKDWDNSAPDSAWTGMRDAYVEALTEGSGCTPDIRLLKDGSAVWDLETEQGFTVDQESAVMLLDFEMENMLAMYDASYNRGGITQAYKFYVQYGVITLSHAQLAKHDEVLKRTAFKDRLGATLDYDINALLEKAIPFNQLPEAARKIWASKATSDSAQTELELAA
ncbi:adenine nucleotide alpha hydrolase family protein [Noviherbaspirillum pedocola]|uniref:Phosphoadenosine phosphosulfate sulfotransferase n=1 Tax=Noviherbaspirillum pedocola TaxID=2801341 RepID=A0A934W7V9_9BURK|nr:phosphoadenosine phosphosulfate sulfotransferase [Noviherbaspirillum pedocola]MBK4737892.1 phosphoadenosine phosphosulfate sulfotransferase [Noviherbaspirillum pedocola]